MKKSYQADLFVGREEILKKLVAWACAGTINENEYIQLIYAPAGYGKTWLLSELSNRLADKQPNLHVISAVAKELDTKEKIEIWLESVFEKAKFSSTAQNKISEKITQLVDSLPQRVIFILDGLDELPDNEQSFIQKQLLEPFRHTYSARMVISCRDSFSLNKQTLRRAANAGLLLLSGLSGIEGQLQFEKLVDNQTPTPLFSHERLIKLISPLASPYRFDVPEINYTLFVRTIKNYQADQTPLLSSDDLKFCWQDSLGPNTKTAEENPLNTIEKNLYKIVIQGKRKWTLQEYAKICNCTISDAGKQIEDLIALSLASILEEEQCYQVNHGFREIILAQNGIYNDPDPEPNTIPHVDAQGAKSIFISYSHKDRIPKDQLVEQLNTLALENLLDVWVDDQIEIGDDWYPEIKTALKKASLAILLVSPQFLTSAFIRNEELPDLFKRRKDEGMRIYGIIARPCAWERIDWLSSIQLSRKTIEKSLMERKKTQRERVLAEIAKEIADLLNASSSQ